jgi:hypothetical protein
LSFISILHIYNIRSLSKKKILEISNKMWRPWGSPPRSTDYKDGFKKIARGKLCLPPLWWGDILFLSCPSVCPSETTEQNFMKLGR